MTPLGVQLLRLGMPAVVLLAACVPHITRIYVPDVPPDSLVHSPCAFNSHLPIGAKIKVGSATAILKLSDYAGQAYVELHLEVPTGTEIQLEGDSISIATGSSEPSRSFRFPNVSLVDTPIVNSYSTLPALKAQQLPPLAPLVGATVRAGTNLSGRHFWLATYVETGAAPTLSLTLPKMKVNSVSQSLQRIAFTQRQITAVALMNC